LPAKALKERAPEAVTLLSGFLASVSLVLAARGLLEESVRLAFVCLALDVLDGFLARRLGAVSERGELLDRVFDRLYQVVVPALIYSLYVQPGLLSAAYATSIITIAYWRLARRAPERKYFSGLPLNVHMVVALSSAYSRAPAPAWLMLALAALSASPIKYYRRRATRSTDSTLAFALKFSAPLALAALPYGNGASAVFLCAELAALAYAALGWVPLALVRNQAQG